MYLQTSTARISMPQIQGRYGIKVYARLSSDSKLCCKYAPATKGTRAQITIPALSNMTKRSMGTCVIPANGGASVLRPGTNLAKSSVLGPSTEKAFLVLLTQVSGCHESLHIRFSTLLPRERPMPYQIPSARSEAITTTSRQVGKLSSPEAINAPAPSKAGKAGIGTPTCSKKTQTKRPA